jgi:hypothetical protein
MDVSNLARYACASGRFNSSDRLLRHRSITPGARDRKNAGPDAILLNSEPKLPRLELLKISFRN